MNQTKTKPRKINFKPTLKQFKALELLDDKVTTELLYGGSVSSGKSRIACYWLILSCLKYPGARYLLGRARLLNLKRTTLKTFFDITREWDIEHLYTFNRQDNVIKFTNGSEIILMDLFQYPSDMDFIKLGSMELTGAVIDEGGEVSDKCYRILKTRLRYKLLEFGLIPKLFICSNPSKNWLYNIFYQPSKDGTLPAYRSFIQALPTDNKYNSKDYLDSLTPESLGMGVYKMLMLGDWDYANSDYDLFDHSALLNSFYINSTKTSITRYITIDPASSGKDATVITLWFGYDCIKILELEKNDTTQIVSKVKELISANNVSIGNVIVDRVGIGVGVFDGLKGCKGFVANAVPFQKEPYTNLKSQLYYRFAQMISNGEIGIIDKTFIDDICIQLEAHKRYNVEADKKAEVTPKSIVKQMIGRSPDFADALSMRMYFDYAGGTQLYFY
jgi:hypothetical protein